MKGIEAIPAPTVKPALVKAVHRGLTNGTLQQYGGVIRKISPPSEKGRIFAHLIQSKQAPLKHVIKWAPQLNVTLQTASNVAMAATALSAVNLGVSAVGFAVLAKKINRLQDSVQCLENVVNQRFTRIESRLDEISMQIAGVSALMASGFETIDDRMGQLASQIDWTMLAKLYSSCESLSDIEAGRSAGYSSGVLAERVREVRVYILSQISQRPWRDLQTWNGDALRARSLMLAYGQAIAAEAYAWRLADQTPTAARMLETQAALFAPLLHDLNQWSLQDTPESTQFLASSNMETMPENLWRRNVLQQPDITNSELNVHTASRWTTLLSTQPQKARAIHRNMDEWKHRAVMSQQLCAPLVEMQQTLTGLQAEYVHLDARQQSWADWEVPNTHNGAGTIRIQAPA